MSVQESFHERAKLLGVTLELKPADRIVVTSFAQRTPLGGTEETWLAMLAGKSGVIAMPHINNWRTNVGAPLPTDYSPEDSLPGKQGRILSRIHATALDMTIELLESGLLMDETGELNKSVDMKRFGSYVSSGYSYNHGIIDIHETINHRVQIDPKTKEPIIDPETGKPIIDTNDNSTKVNPRTALNLMPEQVNGRASIQAKAQGWGANVVEACATGLASINEAASKIREGRNILAIAGGLDDVLHEHADATFGTFAILRATTARNDEPEKASRPFDEKRDGFVAGSGGGVIILEELQHALERGATIYAEVLGFDNSMDGNNPTELDPESVAGTIMRARYNHRLHQALPVDAIFAHATSTPTSERLEPEALRLAFGEELRGIPITAIKSYFGHLLGGAGPVNAIAAIQAMRDGIIPHILNLENPTADVKNPDLDRLTDLNLIMKEPLRRKINTALVVAYGFGGYNSALLLGKYIP